MRYRNLMDLSGKTIIVTGACGLLGKEIVKGISSLVVMLFYLTSMKTNLKNFQTS